jgi:hypothetical protein
VRKGLIGLIAIGTMLFVAFELGTWSGKNSKTPNEGVGDCRRAVSVPGMPMCSNATFAVNSKEAAEQLLDAARAWAEWKRGALASPYKTSQTAFGSLSLEDMAFGKNSTCVDELRDSISYEMEWSEAKGEFIFREVPLPIFFPTVFCVDYISR